MIKIVRKENEIIISGHSGYAEKGKDIICCAVSVLTDSFVRYLNALNKKVDHKFASGYSKITISDDEESQKLFNEFNSFLQDLEEEYPNYIKGE